MYEGDSTATNTKGVFKKQNQGVVRWKLRSRDAFLCKLTTSQAPLMARVCFFFSKFKFPPTKGWAPNNPVGLSRLTRSECGNLTPPRPRPQEGESSGSRAAGEAGRPAHQPGPGADLPVPTTRAARQAPSSLHCPRRLRPGRGASRDPARSQSAQPL